ncbi:ElaB/YgaM/YqjD family protein, partial [Cobetia marina]
ATRARLSAQGDRLAASARESADCADRYVHDNPWTSVGIGAAAGVVIGMLLGRR